jgi:hypothetical protein
MSNGVKKVFCFLFLMSHATFITKCGDLNFSRLTFSMMTEASFGQGSKGFQFRWHGVTRRLFAFFIEQAQQAL